MENLESKLTPPFHELSQDILELSDGRLHTEDGCTFRIHKIELVKNSRYFYRMFCGPLGRGKTDFLVPGVRGEVLGTVVAFVYSGKVDVAPWNACELLEAADYLLLEDLVAEIRTGYVRNRLAPAHCLQLLSTALRIDRGDVVEDCLRYALTRFESVAAVDASGLAQLPRSVLARLLGDRNLCVRGEAAVWEAIRSWVEAGASTRLPRVPGLLALLAVRDVKEDLADRILASSVVARNPACRELLAMKKCDQGLKSSDVLQKYALRQRGPGSCTSRGPSHVHFVAHYCVYNQTDGVVIYVTYDQEIDLWRKIVEVDECPEFLFAGGRDLYLLSSSEGRMLRYGLEEKEWKQLPRLRQQRGYFSAVQLDGLVYVIGGLAPGTEQEVYDVEAYSRGDDGWRDVPPMFPVTSFCATTVGRRIFVVGNSPNFFTSDMVAQAYCADAGSWALLREPPVFRFNFALVAFRGRLYVLGGRNEEEYLKSVEVYDPDQNKWHGHSPLPYTFYLPKAIVLNEKLIVYDNHLEDRTYLKTNPALMWDEDKDSWKPFEESSAMNSIHKYCFFSPDTAECTSWIAKENKEPFNPFSRSPFP